MDYLHTTFISSVREITTLIYMNKSKQLAKGKFYCYQNALYRCDFVISPIGIYQMRAAQKPGLNFSSATLA